MWPVTEESAADEHGEDVASDVIVDPEPVDDTPGGDTPADRPRPRRERVSRWDRPPEPHDWRFYVGTLGKVLIATGLLMFGFVAYQLWGTGIETARAQNRLEDRFESILADAATDEDDGAPPATDAPSTVATTTDPAIVAGDVTSGVPVAIDLSDEAIEQDPIPQPFRGEPLLRLEIPEIGRDDIVVPGVDLDDLKDGPGHYPDTPLPGQLGNAAIAGHRTTYGAPFFDVDQLEPGDEIITTLLNGDRFVYEVTSTQVVSASDYWVVTTRDPNIAELTLTSCHPKYTARDRIVVHSVLNPEKSSNVGFPTFYTLEGDDDGEIAGDDPVIDGEIEVTGPDSALGELDDPAADATTGNTIDSEATDDSVDSGADDPGAVTDDEPTDAPAAADVDPVDGFSQGWFDDRAAFPQIALWGLALTIISLLGYQISKRYRRWSVGILAGIVPFVVALYFFYQNVNRLLPPGI